MDRIDKVLKKLTAKDRENIKAILYKLYSRDLTGLDIKKLRGREDIFRVRKGGMRIIYRIRDKEIYILKIERRSENTYG